MLAKHKNYPRDNLAGINQASPRMYNSGTTRTVLLVVSAGVLFRTFSK